MLARGATAPLGGNRITEDFGAGERAGTVDAQDRLQACGNRTYQYDPQGRRTATDCNGFLTRYRYNGLGEMTGVELPNGNVIDYLYDAMGQRIGRKKNGVLEQGWLYQSRLKIAGELDGSNTLRAVFLQGHGPNVPDGMVKAGHTYRLLTDHLGSVGYVVNIDTGEVSQALEYDEWGKLLRDSNPGYQPFGYAGGLYDPDTGLVRFGMRDYDPREGRWLTKDPIGLQGGYNVYAYVEGNPISYTDPEGLRSPMPQGTMYRGTGDIQGQIWIGNQMRNGAIQNYDSLQRRAQDLFNPQVGTVCKRTTCDLPIPQNQCTPSNPSGGPISPSGPQMSAPGACQCVEWTTGWLK